MTRRAVVVVLGEKICNCGKVWSRLIRYTVEATNMFLEGMVVFLLFNRRLLCVWDGVNRDGFALSRL